MRMGTKLPAFLGRHCPPGVHVQLIADQYAHNLLVDTAAHFLVPHVDIIETVPVGQVVHYQDSVSPTIVPVGYGPESLLAGCVPLC